MTYRLDPDSGLLFVVCQGPATAEGIVETVARWSGEGIFDDHPYIVVDARQMDVQFTGEDLRTRIRAVLDPMMPKGRPRIGVLVDTLVQFGTARQCQAFFGDHGDIGIFRDMVAACDWVNRFRIPSFC